MQEIRRISFISIIITGFAAGIGQILVLRESLILFYGNELSTGLILASWLLWTAAGSSIGGKIGHRFTSKPAVLFLGLLLLTLLIPVTLLWIRASRILWSIPRGELAGPGSMLAISLSATCGFCLVSGFMFALCWHSNVSVSSAESHTSRPIMIYLGEALGTAAGGLFFYFVLLPYASNFKTACVTSMTILGMVMLFIRPWKSSWRIRPALLVIGFVIGMSAAGIAIEAPRLDQISHRWQWGPGLTAVRDTPYNNLALLKDENQYSLFGNGLWFFSVPDPKTAEFSVHFAMLQQLHPRRVLLVGGGSVELVSEILKHPGLKRLDVVEPDPGISDLLREYLPARFISAISDERVHFYHEDAVSFVKHTGHRYDVILLNSGDPINAELNRFYTLEFLQALRGKLNPGGILSFAVSASDYLGPVQVLFLRSFYDTVRAAFPSVVVCLLDSARFLATDRDGVLVTDAQELLDRIRERGLNLQYMQDSYVLDYLNPMRLRYLDGILKQSSSSQGLNQDFAPTCYFNNLLLWASQIHPMLEKSLLILSSVKQKWFWFGLLAALFGFIVLSWSGRLNFSAQCRISVLTMGAAQLVLEILLLLSFQIMEGFVYKQLALIVTLFMAGVALGAAVQSLPALQRRSSRHWFVAVQFAFGLYVLVVLKILFIMHELPADIAGSIPASAVFAALAALAGMLGGLHFALAIRVIAGSDAAPAAVAAPLYAVDLAGAAAGSVVASLYIIPVYGVVPTMLALCAVSTGAALALIKSRQTTMT